MSAMLGKLEQIQDVKAVWVREAQDFTPWLAANLELLSDTIGLELEPISIEASVGQYRADIVCRNPDTGRYVVIENQLGSTDHLHLGQLLTYAAGLKATFVIWVAKMFTDEHRAALDYLNEISGGRISCFGVEIKLWRIGDSSIAPSFQVISKPNDWQIGLTNAKDSAENTITPLKQDQLKYWTAFQQHLLEHNSRLRPRKPLPQHWYDFAVGRSGFWLSAFMNTRDRRLGVSLNCGGPNAKPNFRLLQQNDSEINAQLGGTVKWYESAKTGIAKVTLEGVDALSNQADWHEQFSWLRTTLEKFDDVFRTYISRLDATQTFVAEDVTDPDLLS